MKIEEKARIKILSVAITITTILMLFALTYFIHTRNNLNIRNDLLDAYNYILFLSFIVCLLLSEKFNIRHIKQISMVGTVISVLSLIIFTAMPRIF